MAFLDEFGKELQEEGHHKQADVHPIDIGIRGDNHLVVAKRIQPIFNVEGGLKEVEFLIFVHHLLGQSIGVEGLSAQREDGLSFHLTTLGDATRSRVTFGNEKARIET